MATGYLTSAGAQRIISGGSLRSGITHIALYHADPGSSGTSGHANEIASTGQGYARQPVTWSNTGGTNESNTTVVLHGNGELVSAPYALGLRDEWHARRWGYPIERPT